MAFFFADGGTSTHIASFLYVCMIYIHANTAVGICLSLLHRINASIAPSCLCFPATRGAGVFHSAMVLLMWWGARMILRTHPCPPFSWDNYRLIHTRLVEVFDAVYIKPFYDLLMSCPVWSVKTSRRVEEHGSFLVLTRSRLSYLCRERRVYLASGLNVNFVFVF